jgi:hypothetical protein
MESSKVELGLHIPEFHQPEVSLITDAGGTDKPLEIMCSRNELQNNPEIVLSDCDQQHVVGKIQCPVTTGKVGSGVWPTPAPLKVVPDLETTIGNNQVYGYLGGGSYTFNCELKGHVHFNYPRNGSYINHIPKTIDAITPKVDGDLFVLKMKQDKFLAYFRDGRVYDVSLQYEGIGLIDVDAGFEYVTGEVPKIFLLWWNRWNIRNVYGHHGIDVLTQNKDIHFNFGDGVIRVQLPVFDNREGDVKFPSDGWVLHIGNNQFWLKHSPTIDLDLTTYELLRRSGVVLELDDEELLKKEKIVEYRRDDENSARFLFNKIRTDKKKPNSHVNIVSILKSPSVMDFCDSWEDGEVSQWFFIA